MKESQCPFHGGGLKVPASEMPERIRRLPVHRGFPVPWFVDKINGEYDFRVMDTRKLVRAVKERRCWVCGDPLGKFMAFVIGPMCGINRTSGEPPSHLDCARFSAKHCPFLSRPHMKRRMDEMAEKLTENVAGIGLARNPGVAGVWVTTKYVIFKDPNGKPLFEIGEPESVEWYAEGREATQAEVMHSIDTGIHHLREMCDQERWPQDVKDSHAELNARLETLKTLLPPA